MIRLVQSPFIDACYSLYGCSACGSAFFDPQEHDVDLQAFYNDQEYVTEGEFTWSRDWYNEVQKISRLLGNRPGPFSILDVGCRTGDFLLHWDSLHRRVGVEIHRRYAAIARLRGLDVIADMAENIQWEEPFTVVSCYAVLEHISHPEKLLDTLCRSTASGGVLSIMVPSYESRLRQRLDRKGIYWHMYAPPGHLSFYSAGFLDTFTSRRGLKLVHRKYTSGGIAPAYAPWSPGAALLRDGSFSALRNYFTHAMRGSALPDTSRLHRPMRTAHQITIDLLERLTPLSRLPYFDHMYSYYVKM